MQAIESVSSHAGGDQVVSSCKEKKGRLVQIAHAATFCEVELTNYRLEEASSDAAEWKRCE